MSAAPLRPDLAAIAAMIRGQPGTAVRIQVNRLSSPQPLEFSMKRALVQVDQVIGRQVPNAPIGYLKIRSFGDASSAGAPIGLIAWPSPCHSTIGFCRYRS